MTGLLRSYGVGELPAIGPAIVSMGVFDGVHLGHRAILAATRAAAADRAVRSVALVFDPPPEELLRPGSIVARLAPPSVTASRIEAAGIDRVLLVRFDEPLRELSAEAFLLALAPAIELRGLVMSRRSAFGRDRGGTVDHVEQLGAEHGFTLGVVEAVEVDGAIVSSTRIRGAIAAGDLQGAERMGVRPYLEGTVVRGDGRGHDLGFPTANLRFEYMPAMPSLGIYAGRVSFDAVDGAGGHPALVSIGTRPTFHEGGRVLTEVHLLDFTGDLYGTRLGVDLVARLRDERRFADADALVDQMRRDAEMGRAALGAT